VCKVVRCMEVRPGLWAEWGGTLVGREGVVGWMCDVKVKDGSSKWRDERETRNK